MPNKHPTQSRPSAAATGPASIVKLRVGEYWIDLVAGSPNFYVCWRVPNPELGYRDRASLGTADPDEALVRLGKFIEAGGKNIFRKGGDPLARDVVEAYLDQPKKREKWNGTWRTLLAALDTAAPGVRMSGLVGAVQEEIIRALHARPMRPNSLQNQMILLAAASRWANTPDRHGEIMSAHHFPVLHNLTAICELLEVDRPKLRTWHPTADGMAAIVAELAPDERFRRLILLLLVLTCRTMAAATARRSQLNLRNGLFALNPEGRLQTKKRRPVLPLPDCVLAEVASWPEEEWVGLSYAEIWARMQELRQTLDMPRLMTSCVRDYMATALRHAHVHLGVQRVPDEEIQTWMGHRPSIEALERAFERDDDGTTNEGYGAFLPEYLDAARTAAGAIVRDLDRRSGGGTLLRAGQATGGGASMAFRQIAANPLPFPREETCGLEVSADRTPRSTEDEPEILAGENGPNRAIPGPVLATSRQAAIPATLTASTACGRSSSGPDTGKHHDRGLPLGGSADGSPREELDFDGLKAGKTVEIGGARGRFRQVSAKPICRLDDIFEPTLGDVIQESGSEVLQFAPDEPGSLVSAPILFVQDQRHLIKN